MPEPLSLVIQTKSRNVIFNPQMIWTNDREVRCSLASHDTAYESLGYYDSVQRAFDVKLSIFEACKNGGFVAFAMPKE